MKWVDYAMLMDTIDAQFVEEAASVNESEHKKTSKKRWGIWVAAAACLLLIAGGVFSTIRFFGNHRSAENAFVSDQFKQYGLHAEKLSEPFLLPGESGSAMSPEEYSAVLKNSSVVQVALHDPEFTVVSGEDTYHYYLTANATVEEQLWGTISTESFMLCSEVSSEMLPNDKFPSDLSFDGKCTDCSWLVAVQPASEISWEIDGETIPAETISEYCVSQVIAPVPDCLQLVAKEDAFLYKYVGDTKTIDIPGLNFTLSLPENWAGGVDVFLESTMDGPNYNTLIVSNRSLSEEYGKHFPSSEDNAISKTLDGVLKIHWVPFDTWDYSQDIANGYCIDCGTLDGYQYVMWATHQENPYDSGDAIMRNMLIEEIGQEKYDALVGSYQCTPSEAKNWLTYRKQ